MKIEELARQAGLRVDYDGEIGPAYMGSVDAGYRKFAELIIQQCAGLVQGVPTDTMGYQSAALWQTADQKIKQHFGVEE